MRHACTLSGRVATTPTPQLLLTGAAGHGHRVSSRARHFTTGGGPPRQRAFVSINCASEFSRPLIEGSCSNNA